jgi:hypothetical protein
MSVRLCFPEQLIKFLSVGPQQLMNVPLCLFRTADEFYFVASEKLIRVLLCFSRTMNGVFPGVYPEQPTCSFVLIQNN